MSDAKKYKSVKNTTRGMDPCATSPPTTAQSFKSKYFNDTNPDMSVANVFTRVFEFMTGQWYFDTVDPDEAVFWDPTLYFLKFSTLVANGKSGSVMDPSTYLRKILNYLLGYISTQVDQASQDLTKALEEINGWPDLGTVFDFPSIKKDGIGTDHVVLRLPFSIDSKSCPSLYKTFMTPNSIETALKNFYRDHNGVYTLDGLPKVMKNSTCNSVTTTLKPIQKTIQGTTYTVGQYVDVNVKMSFMMMLRQFVQDPSVLQSLDMETLKNISVSEGIPIPVNGKAQDMGCSDEAGYCNCLYYCAFGPYECPGYGYYYCQFYDACKCVVSRAVPFDTSLADRIHNKFGMCFDINCADQGMRPANCDLCSTFRQRHCDARPPLRHEALLVMSSPGVGDLTEFF